VEKLGRFVAKNAKKIIPITVITVLILAAGLFKVRIDANIKSMLPHDMDVVMANDKMEEIFGGSETIVIAIGNEKEGVFNRRTLTKIKEITDKLEAVKGVDDVMSIPSLKNMKARDWGLEVFDYMPQVPETDEGIERLKKELLSDEIYAGQMVSKDGKYAAIMVMLNPGADENKVYREVKKAAEKYKRPEAVHFAGTPAVRVEVAQNIVWDLLKLIPFVIILILLILRSSLGTKQGMVLPLAVVGMSVSATIGLMGYLGVKISIMNNILPIMLLAIGTAYGIHVIARFYEELEVTDNTEEAVIATIRDIGQPVMLAGLTTMAGFLTLLTAPLDDFGSFGVFAAVGVFMETVLSLTFLPAALLISHSHGKPEKKGGRIAGPLAVRIGKMLTGIAGAVNKKRGAIIGAALVIMAVFAAALPRLYIEMNPLTFFKKSSEIRQSDRIINENLGGSVNLNVLVSGDIQSAKVLKEMDKMQEFLEKDSRITNTVSLATMVKRINRAINEDDEKHERIPDTKEKIAQLLLLYSMSSSPSDFDNFVDTNYEHGRIVARMNNLSTRQINDIAQRFENYLQEQKPDIEQIELSGFAIIIKELTGLIVSSQIRGLVSAIALIFLIAFAAYRSFKLGVYAVIPLVMTVVVSFGLLAYAGIPISTPIALMANIVIGTGIDYSLHFISRLRIEMKKSPEQAVERTIKTVGGPILYNALSVGAGFLVLLFSGFVPIKFLGAMIALSMFLCGFSAITFLAALVAEKKKVKGGS